MDEIIIQIQNIGKNLLQDKIVDYIIGYAEGSIPYTTTPVFINNVQELDKLVWNEFCAMNLVSLIPKLKPKGKIGLILKPCDIRSLIVLLNENQLKRDDVVIIGVPCTEGVVNRYKITEENNKMENILSVSCKFCKDKKPSIYNYIIEVDEGKINLHPELNEFQDVIDFEKLNRKERQTYFSKELARCTKCYACFGACPLCYCETCFVDQNQPSWFRKTVNIPENLLMHITRAFHLAGRCVDCGACDRACPENLDIHVIYRKLRKTVFDRWGVKSGMNLGEKAILGSYDLKDSEEFIVEED